MQPSAFWPAAVLLAFSSSSWADSVRAQFAVTATVVARCESIAASYIELSRGGFGAPATSVPQGAVTLNCHKGTPFTVAVSNGNGASAVTRRTLPPADSHDSSTEARTPAANSVIRGAATATGNPQTLRVNGNMLNIQTEAGAQDAGLITVTVTF